MYDSPLLDDIHNYFPELLYAPEQFRSVADVLAYVQQRTRERFDLFSRGRREYERTRIVTTPPLRATVSPGISMLFETRNAIPERMNREANVAAEFLNAINAMGGIFGPTVPVQHVMPSSFLDPVIVRPTAEQIQSATALERVDAEEDMCAICQDEMPPGSEALNLNACDHRFHEPCIRTWFATNVVCPVCRHDIREPSPSHSQGP